jgi:hypothetical protein
MHASAVEDLQKRQSKLILLEQLSIVSVDSKRLSLTNEAVSCSVVNALAKLFLAL